MKRSELKQRIFVHQSAGKQSMSMRHSMADWCIQKQVCVQRKSYRLNNVKLLKHNYSNTISRRLWSHWSWKKSSSGRWETNKWQNNRVRKFHQLQDWLSESGFMGHHAKRRYSIIAMLCKPAEIKFCGLWSCKWFTIIAAYKKYESTLIHQPCLLYFLK
jgi:hypothetical protein